MHIWGHFCTITKHKLVVMQHCFRLGLYGQGLCHDLSKYSPTEFWVGAKYYQGNRSPNTAERDAIGYSTAWMHHKGRNKHHFEYWVDLNKETKRYEPVQMPRKYLAEMAADRIAACKVYKGDQYKNSDSLNYLENSAEKALMHPETLRQLTVILEKLAKEGEDEAFRFIQEVVLRGEDF